MIDINKIQSNDVSIPDTVIFEIANSLNASEADYLEAKDFIRTCESIDYLEAKALVEKYESMKEFLDTHTKPF